MKKPPVLPPSATEQLWTHAFLVLSAVMAAFALLDFQAGRLAHGLGDAGVACLLLGLMVQLPFVRAIVRASGADQSRADIAREVERIRALHPWADRLSSVGWMMLIGSLALRLTGMQ